MISKIAVKRPVTMIMVLIAVILLGAVSMVGMPQALTPDIDYPYAVAVVTYPGAGPEEVEQMVTEPLEGALASVEGVKNIMSVSSENVAMVMIEFDMGTDLNFATLDMREKISMAQMGMPDDVGSPTIMKANMDSMPVMQLFISSDMEISELGSFVEDNITSRFERISGVAQVSTLGATEDEIQIKFDQDKLQGYGLTMDTVSSILSAENISYPSGSISNGNTDITVKTFGEFQDISDIREIPLTLGDGSVVTLNDVADIQSAQSDAESITRMDGQQAVGLFISKSSGANIVGLSDDVQKEIESIQKKYGNQINIQIGFDQADFVRQAISSVGKTAVEGAILAVIVIFLFLRNTRSTLVIGISIPASVLATFCVMKVLGMSLNMITLGALTLAIGMLVDNSVVVLENVFRRNKQGLNAEQAAIQGSSEVGLAVMASTLTSVVVYLPIALSGGMAGMMFKDFSITIIAALFCSLLVALTVVPMLCSRLLDGSVSEDYIRIGPFFHRYRIVSLFTRLIDWLIAGYGHLIRGALKRRKRVLLLFIIVFVASISLVSMVGWELIPEMDEGSFSVTVEMPEGTSLEEQDAYIRPLEEYAMNIPELDHITLNVGGSTGISMGGGNSISVILKDDHERSTKEVMNEMKDHFKDLAGADVSFALSSSMGMSMETYDLTLDVRGADMDLVSANTVRLANEIRGLDCVSEVSTDVEDGSPEVKVILNRSTASHYGLTTYQVATALKNALDGSTSTTLKVGGEEIDIKLSLDDKYATSVEDMKAVVVSSPRGNVPVGQIATLQYDNAPVSIQRQNQEMQNAVNINFKESIDSQDAVKQVTALTDGFLFDEGVSIAQDGMQEQMMEAFGDLLLALVISLALVYIVLASQFESAILPAMVMMSIPFAMSGAFLGLFLTGKSLSMTSFIGLIMLVGIVVNNAILLVEFINQNKQTMRRDDAIAEAGKVRMRPILMTTLTTVFGMVPMALGIGEGMEMMAPMGISIIGGLIMSTIVTLFLIPILYSIVDDMETKNRKRKEAKKKVKLYQEALWLAKEAGKRDRRQSKREAKQNS
ncbi:MAG: efflux RND transporter permease subunit [Anaerovoracaceae bacterium]